ncbi:hypothetical protein OAG71_00420 [bacterium]|nr:hypothetical protein [bacterium]
MSIWAGEAFGQILKAEQIEKLKIELMDCLGESFEYAGGEIGSINDTVGFSWTQNFLFAKVRLTVEGEYAFKYTVRFRGFDEEFKSNVPDKAEYVFAFEVGKHNQSRVISLNRYSEAFASPIANVGDTLLIPINVGEFCFEYKFSTLDRTDKGVNAFFLSYPVNHEEIMDTERTGNSPVSSTREQLDNRAGEWLETLAAWRNSAVHRNLSKTSHSVGAYFKCRKTGELNLTGKSTAGPLDLKKDRSFSIRIVNADVPMTATLTEQFYNTFKGKSTTQSHITFPPRTINLRIGDHVLLDCDRIVAKTEDQIELNGTIHATKFRELRPYFKTAEGSDTE